MPSSVARRALTATRSSEAQAKVSRDRPVFSHLVRGRGRGRGRG